MIPARRPDQSFEDHQREVAGWIGCDVATMNAYHDPTHEALCKWLGVRSHSLACADGAPHDPEAAWREEAAVLAVQRLAAYHAGWAR